MKRFLLFSLSAGMTALMFSSYSSGPAAGGLGNRTGSTGSNANCAGGGCHGANSPKTSVNIAVLNSSNQPVTSYTPGTTYKVIVGGGNTDARPKFGFQATCVKKSATGTQAGTFSATGSVSVRTAQTPNIVEHNTPINGTVAGGAAVYSAQFNWTAPTAGTGAVQFFATLNAADGTPNTSTDQPQTMTSPYELSEGTTSISAIKPLSLSMYPNPVMDELHVKLEAHTGNCLVQIADVTGRTVSLQGISLTDGKATVNTRNLVPGSYHIMIQQAEQLYGASFVKQ